MIIVNTDYISGKKLQTISLVRGSTVHSKNIGRDILSGLKTIVGGGPGSSSMKPESVRGVIFAIYILL